VFMLLLDWASKVNYSVDAIVIGAVLGTAQVAVWTVAQRLAEVSQRLTNQLNDVLFPAVVDSDTGNRPDRLQLILVQGTRLSLAAVLPVAFTLGLLARPVVTGWVGPGFDGAVAVLQVLAVVVAIRVGTATANTVLKGAGKHRLLAVSNVLTAAGNLLLSLLLVRRFGLAGVAYGTLVPIASSSLLVLFPAACHRVGLGLGTALRVAVWPAAWPGLVVALGVAAARPHVPPSLPLVALCAAAAGLAYLALFLLWGLPPQDRRLYLSKAAILLARVRRVEATT
ncbi:MAG: lipopolysaccharide biosynthesis protein, partial [Acidobacteria bacterium]